MLKEIITFSPKEVTRKLLSGLTDRARDIIKKRYGLEEKDGMTLEAIGGIYGVTRERVRQIEEFALNSIRKSIMYQEAADNFAELEAVMNEYGGVVHEGEFLRHIDKNELAQNHIHFLLVLGGVFTKLKEDDSFHHRWTTDRAMADRVQESIRGLCQSLSENDLLSEKEMVETFLKKIGDELSGHKTPERARRWLEISKDIGMSPVGEWGLTSSPNVRVRGIRDYAFLILRQHGSPMHFTEVAKAIRDTFGKKANPATCHNELIKDGRFVLVGRGIYALAEWGYERGVVRDVITSVLKKSGPMTEKEVLEKVLKERHVKHNTVLVNLKNPKYFKKDKAGKYLAV